MDYARNTPKIVEGLPQRQGLEPLHVVLLLRRRQLVEKRLVLRGVLGGAGPQKFARTLRVFRRVGDRIELMISHHNGSAADVNHRLDQFQGLALLGAPVDEITDEDRVIVRMGVRATTATSGVAHANQSVHKHRRTPVHIADEVVTTHIYSLLAAKPDEIMPATSAH